MAKKSSDMNIRIPAIRQLPSGSYFCQLRLGGRSISITDDDPDVVRAKAYAYKMGVLKERRAPMDITVGKAIEKYIDYRRAVLSPSTICGYAKIQRTRFLNLQKMKLSALTPKVVQQAVNDEVTMCSPKSVKNAYMLIAAAIAYAGGERYEDIRLPQVPPKQTAYLTPEQIPILMTAAKGTHFEVGILLGLWSCRRSEIFGLKWDNVDLEHRTIRISTAVVNDETYNLVEKPVPKNRSSVRTIPLSDQLYDALSAIDDKTGYVVKGNPNSLYKAVNRLCEKNGLPKIGAHGLRHSFASLAYSLGIPEKVTMQIGGWETDDVMRRIYTHLSEADVGTAASQMLSFYNNSANAIANESE